MKIMSFFKRQNSVVLTTIFGLIVIGILICLPTGYEDALIYQGTERAVGKVVGTDNSAIITSGLIQSGEQLCTLEIGNGIFAGQTLEGVNFLSGSLEKDKIFKTGDRALLTISYKGQEIKSVILSDHYRLDKEFILLAVFAVFLVVFAGKIGFQAILSFFYYHINDMEGSCSLLSEGLFPGLDRHRHHAVLTAIIIFFVYGPDKRTLSAVLGALLGVATTCILGILFTDLFKIHGAVMTSSESLLYSGYQDLDLTSIFMASIFIGASGAMMDLAVDITSAVYEVISKKPDILPAEAVLSGLRVGRAAMGTMTTTLLLAYSGGYISLLMVFMAQGTPIDHILNYKYVAAEVLDTVVGSFGLVTVAPFTALMAGLLLTRKKGSMPS